ncbi:MAG: DNA cytosine methyltransferase [Symploca sp. SIO2E9]|nr:DNA cytosine methyltransferase [Symploca sp. SIO2E9]
MTKNKWEERPIGVDLFAGAGGMTLGFEQAGFDVLASVELDPIHCATHEFNFPFWSILCKSVTEITAKEIRNNSSIGERDIDVVFGGPPCQGFSLIGKRTLDDPRNSLIFDFIRLVLELKPKFFVLENVPGLAIGEHRKFLVKIINELRKNCYEVEEKYQVLNAAHYGVPQKRIRLFIIGCREDLSLPKYPEVFTQASIYQSNTEPGKFISKDMYKLPFCPTVEDAIGDLPEVENYPELWKKDWAIVEYGEASDYVRQLRCICPLEDDYSYQRQYNLQMLTSSLRTMHNAQTAARFAETLPGKMEKVSRFFKLHPQGICNTLRAGTNGNRGAFTSARPIHPFKPRCITVREAARLHSYPDWFRFHVTKWHGFRQIGNSVPPLLAKAIAAEIIRTLGVSPIKPNFRQKLGEERLLQLKMSQATKYYLGSSE